MRAEIALMSGSAFAVTHHAFSSGAGRTSDGNGSHASTLKSPSYTKSVSWQHHPLKRGGAGKRISEGPDRKTAPDVVNAKIIGRGGDADDFLHSVVLAAFTRSKQRYGAPRLTDELRAQGYPFNVKTVAASLRRQGLRAKASRKFSPVSYRAHGLPVSENLLEQDFYASGPNQKWAGDITYLRTDEGWLYLAVVIDLWSRAVIGWSMSPRMTAQLACDALQMALWRRKRPRNVIVHTDRGGQYCSADYQAQLKRHNLRGSMSAKGCCYDNACVESFFHSLKVECIHGEHFISREIMRATVFNYIECDYNRWRRHSWCGGLSPEQFENQNLA